MWWVPVFCIHHDEEAVFGADQVPCPFCGFGTPPEASYPDPRGQAEDSNAALQHAMSLTKEEQAPTQEPGPGLVNLRHYW